jgi:hypothetical protein
MKMRHVMLVAAMVCTSSANAEEMSFVGAGSSPCSLLNANASPDPSQNITASLIFTWVQGFLSGMNASAFNLPQRKALFDLNAIPSQMQWDYLVAYCRANPSAWIPTAAIDLGVNRLKRAN